MSYQSKIMSVLGRLGSNGTASPDTSNTGAYLADAYLWDTVEAYAKGKSKEAWERLEKELDIKAPEVAGAYVLATSPSFTVTAKVTQPVKRFNVDELAKALKKRYRVPEPTTKEMVEHAKVPTKSVCTLAVIERAS